MFSQLIFLPSLMLSGIMFPTSILPKAFDTVGKIFPATHAMKIMTSNTFRYKNVSTINYHIINYGNINHI